MLPNDFTRLEELDSNIQVSLRYTGIYNFLGIPVNGYKHNGTIIITKHAAKQLLKLQKEVSEDGYSLVIYDAYRPQKAVDHFTEWGKTMQNITNQEIFFPTLTKEQIFEQGFVASKSTHSRGSTVDLTLIEKGKQVLHEPILSMRRLKDGRQIPFYNDNTVDMGSSFDLFDNVSFPSNREISEQQYKLRMYLQSKMIKYGFEPLSQEWWHFTLKDEPFPNTYFNFDIMENTEIYKSVKL